MKTHATLSEQAIRVLTALREQQALRPERALTDARLAELTHLNHRHIIDARGELLQAGYLVLARCTRPAGSWITESPVDARAYLRSLTRRAVGILGRRRSLKRAIARCEERLQREAGGQMLMFPREAST